MHRSKLKDLDTCCVGLRKRELRELVEKDQVGKVMGAIVRTTITRNHRARVEFLRNLIRRSKHRYRRWSLETEFVKGFDLDEVDVR